MTDEFLRQGRAWTWLPLLLALGLLVGFVGYGVVVYDSIPGQVPMNYGPGGEANRWEDKSAGTVFFPLLMTVGGLFVVPVLAAVLPAFMAAPDDATYWTRLRIEGSVRGIRSGLGWVTLLVVALMGWVSVQMWRAAERISPWPVALLVLLILVALLLAYRRWSGWARATAVRHGIVPSPQEQAEDRLWLPLGLYNDPAEPRVLVPKRAGHGVGTTMNVGNPRGKALVVAFVAILFAPVLLSAWLG